VLIALCAPPARRRLEFLFAVPSFSFYLETPPLLVASFGGTPRPTGPSGGGWGRPAASQLELPLPPTTRHSGPERGTGH
jgi:hypothetical protein